MEGTQLNTPSTVGELCTSTSQSRERDGEEGGGGGGGEIKHERHRGYITHTPCSMASLNRTRFMVTKPGSML